MTWDFPWFSIAYLISPKDHLLGAWAPRMNVSGDRITPIYKPWSSAIWKGSHNPRSWGLTMVMITTFFILGCVFSGNFPNATHGWYCNSFQVMSFNSSCWMPPQDRAETDLETMKRRWNDCGWSHGMWKNSFIWGGLLLLGAAWRKWSSWKNGCITYVEIWTSIAWMPGFLNRKQLKGDLPNFLLFGRLSF